MGKQNKKVNTKAKKKVEVKENTNDQGEIINALKKKQYDKVWEKVKYISYQEIADTEDRRIYFQPIAELFDYTINNNFIHFYKTRLSYLTRELNNQPFITTHNHNIIKELLRQSISPDDECSSRIVRDIQCVETGGVIN